MLPEIGASELLVIAIVALIVVGPKDLPVLLRRFGQFMAKVRGMANEFRASFDEMARQSELDDLRKEVEAMRRGQFADMSISDSAYRETVSDIENSLSDVGVQMHPPMSYQHAQTSEPPEPLEAPAPEPVKAARKPRAAKPKEAAGAAPKTRAAAAKTPARPRAKKLAAKKIVE
ncbi:Sec-independent protein translocase protein TatB [Phenylobacterium sp. J426]|uniref:Sec-independent protein translocase protein TatB n=1 Tax=Phenylobacterium sp. J426 TaxID=2898439 RepID=UPI00215090F0|nr:Sec-independent protein translocase protein TatB [Phenylobacterium sp. J426]MCR5876038.1 Sec-independent protein translocase protein TatB [Phenylobacterium sp. J426]